MNGKKIKGKVIGSGLRMWDFSQMCKIDYYRLSMIVNGRAKLKPDELQRIKSALNKL